MPDNLPIKFGRQLITRVANPAAAADFTYTPSTRFVEMLYSVEFILTADANAANRAPFLEISDVTGVILTLSSEFNVTANNAVLCSFRNGAANFRQLFGATDVIFNTIPTDLIIPLSGTIDSRIENIQAADQISAIVVTTSVWSRT